MNSQLRFLSFLPWHRVSCKGLKLEARTCGFRVEMDCVPRLPGGETSEHLADPKLTQSGESSVSLGLEKG